MDQAYRLLKKSVRDTFLNYSHDVIVQFCEITIQTPGRESRAAEFIQYFFERAEQPTQFYIRALLIKARIIAMQGHADGKKAEPMIEVLKEALGYVNKALGVIFDKPDPKSKTEGAGRQNYTFLIYNASVTVYNIIRFMLRPNWQKNFTEIVEQISKKFD